MCWTSTVKVIPLNFYALVSVTFRSPTEPTFLYDKRRHINQQMRSFMEVKQKKKDAFLPLLMHAPNPSSKSKLQLSQGQDAAKRVNYTAANTECKFRRNGWDLTAIKSRVICERIGNSWIWFFHRTKISNWPLHLTFESAMYLSRSFDSSPSVSDVWYIYPAH